jgi:two-component system chemotaxis sensor kinase CheA
LLISVSDDGRGIDWDALRARAVKLGLPSETQSDLELALFADGVSTAKEATDTSGRGVGMAALREAVAALGGTIDLETKRGEGTTLRLRFPEADGQIMTLRPPTVPTFQVPA